MSNNPRLNKQINAFQNHETETHYNINRDYNPVTGRYIQSDPIGFDGGINGFGYGGGNSIGFVDKEGLIFVNLTPNVKKDISVNTVLKAVYHQFDCSQKLQDWFTTALSEKGQTFGAFLTDDSIKVKFGYYPQPSWAYGGGETKYNGVFSLGKAWTKGLITQPDKSCGQVPGFYDNGAYAESLATRSCQP